MIRVRTGSGQRASTRPRTGPMPGFMELRTARVSSSGGKRYRPTATMKPWASRVRLAPRSAFLRGAQTKSSASSTPPVPPRLAMNIRMPSQ